MRERKRESEREKFKERLRKRERERKRESERDRKRERERESEREGERERVWTIPTLIFKVVFILHLRLVNQKPWPCCFPWRRLHRILPPWSRVTSPE